MSVFSVDSDSLLTATAQVRGTADRLQAEAQSMHAQLTQLQGAWTGSASVAFHEVLENWRATQRQLEESLTSIGNALGNAGRQYAETEQLATSLFR